jgi:hypothetical protein
VILLSGAGLAGIAGCAFNVSPGERLAATAHEEAESKTPVTTSALSRILKRQPKESPTPETETATSNTKVRGRLFSAIVDRFPGRHREASDPFLEAEIEAERQRAQAGTSTAIADEESKPAANSVVLGPKTERSDEELWKIFSNDSAVSVKTAADPTLAAREPAAPALDRKSLQKRERANPFADADPQPAPQTRTASTSVASAPIVGTNDDANPFARFVGEPAASQDAPASDATVATAAQRELRDLISQARQHEQRGALRKAHETALEAAAIADREQIELATDEERPADLVRRLEQRLEASTHDPFSDSHSSDATQSATAGASPFSTGRSLAGSLAVSAPVRADTASSARHEASLPKAHAPAFPKAPEWRGVRANSPVSLAVVEQPEPVVTADDPSPVRHADMDEAAPTIRGTGRLLPRNLVSHDPVVKLNDQPLAFANEVAADGPLLAPPREAAPLVVAPAPPLATETAVATLAAPAVADEELDRNRGYGGWIVGGLLLVAGLWLLGIRGRNPFGRHTAARR